MRRGLAGIRADTGIPVPGLMEIGRIPVDVALIQTCVLTVRIREPGMSVDIVRAARVRQRREPGWIAEVNPGMPRTMGDSMIHMSEIDHIVAVDTPVTEYVTCRCATRWSSASRATSRDHRRRPDTADRAGSHPERGARHLG